MYMYSCSYYKNEELAKTTHYDPQRPTLINTKIQNNQH